MISADTLTLLYIEDDTPTRNSAAEYLGRYYKQILTASNGEEGLASYLTHQPDIIITDIQMPRLDGLSLAAKIRESDKNTPIIITTAHTNTAYLLQAVELQLVKYLIKPVTAEKLHEALTIALDTLHSAMVKLGTHTRYDRLNQTLFYDEEIIKLTHNELLFFDFLVQHSERTITYAEIESLIWAYEGMSMDALRSLVRGLRKKASELKIENISGVGYRVAIDS